MFVLAEMKDTVRVKPWNFGVDLREAIASKLNKKLANKVVHNVGLCIVLHDITSIGDSYLFPGDGSSHTPVKFRFVVFRPFIDEILTGRIRSCNHEGVQVSMEFFDDITIPYEYLQQPSKFIFLRSAELESSTRPLTNASMKSVSDEDEQLWVWEYKTDDEGHDLFMDINEEIRFRVVDEVFTDLSPAGPEMSGEKKSTDDTENKRSPYTITGSISEPGLGLRSWWSS